MELVKWLRKYWLLIMVLIVLLAFFYPKYCSSSPGGLQPPGNTVNRNDCTCLGIKYDSSMQCSDCGTEYLCAGIPTSRSCFEWVSGTDISTEKQVECR
jgi:hypothetical protein